MPPATTVHVELLGSAFEIRSPDAVVAGELRRLWLPLLSEPRQVAQQCCFAVRSTPQAWTAWQGSVVLGSRRDLSSLLALLATHVNSTAISRCQDLVLHAGAVACGSSVIALAAVSGGGKSTLTGACLSLGWDYVTDEALCLRPDGAVVPYPKPLTMSGRSRALLGREAVNADEDGELLMAVEDLDGRVPRADRLVLTDVVLLDRSDDVEALDCELVELHPSAVLTGLLPLSFNHYKQPTHSVEVLARAARTSRAWRLGYTDARAAAALLSEAFSQRDHSPRSDGLDHRSTPA